MNELAEWQVGQRRAEPLLDELTSTQRQEKRLFPRFGKCYERVSWAVSSLHDNNKDTQAKSKLSGNHHSFAFVEYI